MTKTEENLNRADEASNRKNYHLKLCEAKVDNAVSVLDHNYILLRYLLRNIYPKVFICFRFGSSKKGITIQLKKIDPNPKKLQMKKIK